MAGEVDICNTALGHLGDDATVASISPPDGSVQAGQCARFYPLVRDALLSLHDWNFSTARAVLAVSPIAPPIGWAYAYALPSNCKQPIAILMPNSIPDLFSLQTNIFTPTGIDTLNAKDFVVETNPIDGTGLLYTNVEKATLLYSLGVIDTTKFSALFTMALARLLASYLAGPIIKGVTGTNVAKLQLEIFQKMDLPAAKEDDAAARQASPYTSSTPAAIAARM